jgi:G3E family GTPase
VSASVVTPVTVLTGFLGSGKTTLLNRLLRHPGLGDTAVLINEFGTIPIDHLLVREASENIIVMDSGCICCSVQGDLVRALRDLYFKRANNEIPPFRRAVIETTGLADPAPILHTLIEMPVVAARYSLSGVVTTVDAQYGMKQLDEHFESVKQAAVADRIVITKTDLADAGQVAALQNRLQALNPGARILSAIHGEADPALLFDTGLYQPDSKSSDVKKWLNADAYRPVTPRREALAGVQSRPSRTQWRHDQRHDERIQSFAITFGAPVQWQDLLDALETLMTVRGDHLLRIKGIVNVAGEDKPRVIHAVQHTLYPHATLPQWPDADRRTRLVFIQRDLDADFIVGTLNHFLTASEGAALRP